MKKRVLSFVLAIALAANVFGMAACSNGGSGQADGDNLVKGISKADYESMSADDLLAKIVSDTSNVSVEEYVDLVSTLGYVEIQDSEDDPYNISLNSENKTKEALDKLESTAVPSLDQYLDQMINSSIPQVRGFAASNIFSMIGGVSDENLEKVKPLFENETDPYVLWCLTRAVSNEMKNADVAAFIYKMAESDNFKLRIQAALAIGNSWSKGVDGTVEKIIEMMDDENDYVKACAIGHAGQLDDNAVIAPLEKILKNKSMKDFHDEAVTSLVAMWYDYPFHESTNEKAYKVTMNYLNATPRTEDIPAWTAVGSFNNKADDKYKAWKKKAKYFDTDKLYTTMVNILKDKNANWLGRSAAIKAIKTHCPDKFKSLKSVVKGLKDDKAELLQKSYEDESKK